MRARRAPPSPTETSYSVSGSSGCSTTARIPPRLTLSVHPDVSRAFARIVTRSDASWRAPPVCLLWLGGWGVFDRVISVPRADLITSTAEAPTAEPGPKWTGPPALLFTRKPERPRETQAPSRHSIVLDDEPPHPAVLETARVFGLTLGE